MSVRSRQPHRIRSGAMLVALTLAASLALLPVGGAGLAQQEFACLEFDTELVSLNLTGGPYPMPLASDPGNLLGDSVEGYGFVDSLVTITLSSQRPPEAPIPGPGPASPGSTLAFAGGEFIDGSGRCGSSEPIDPDALDGQEFFVESFFDVFFDITVTDVDDRPGRNYPVAPPGAPETGVAFMLPDNGPARMQSFSTAIFDKDAPNFGLIPPPQAEPYIGHFLIEIDLPGDINGNGEDDKIKFTLASHAAGDENRTFTQLPDGTVRDQFDSAAFLEGAIVDQSSDPPFTLGALDPAGGPAFTGPFALTGPTTATSTLLTPVLRTEDHYLFYDVKRARHAPKFERLTAFLDDQFHAGVYTVEMPEWFANPVSKNGEPIFDPFVHLTSYKIKAWDDFEPVVGVGVLNQFHEVPLLVDVEKPDRLLVPGLKGLVDPPLPPIDLLPVDHFTCYKVDLSEGVEFSDGIEVSLSDQFTEVKLFEVKKPTRLCTPTMKIVDEPVPVITTIQHPDVHLMCYQLKPLKGELKHEKLEGFWVADQFGLHQFDSKKEKELCVPSEKILP